MVVRPTIDNRAQAKHRFEPAEGSFQPLTPQADSVSANATQLNDTPPAPRWRLWIDGCGGYLLLSGCHWTLGGVSQTPGADIRIRADLPRLAGTIERSGGDYFWRGAGRSDRPELITSGQPLGIQGSARLHLHQPSALCESAVLTLSPPHRFDQHIDAVILANETFLVGPSLDCHVRCRDSTDRAVLIRRGAQWTAKAGLAGEPTGLRPGHRTVLRSLALTLEET